MEETLEDLIKKEPHVKVEFALWGLERAVNDLNEFIGLIHDLDIEDLKNYMVRINQLILKVLNIRGQSSEQNRVVC